MTVSPLEQTRRLPISNKLRLISTQPSDWLKALPWYADAEVLYYGEGLRKGAYDLAWVSDMFINRSAKEVLKTLVLSGRHLEMTYFRVPEIYHYYIRAKALFESLGFKKVRQNYRGAAYELHDIKD